MKLHAPITVYWSMTRGCNLNCAFCLIDAGKAAPDESPELRLALAKELAKERILKVVLTGGEPTILPDLIELISIIRQSGAFIELTTNGTKITGEKLREWKRAGVDRVQISLNGSNPALNDHLMGDGAFDKISAALSILDEGIIPYDIKTTLVRENMKDIVKLIKLPEIKKARRLKIQEFAPMGRGVINFKRFKISKEDLINFEKESIINSDRDGPEVDFRSLTLQYLRIPHPPPCTIGDPSSSRALVTETGNLLPCTMSLAFGIENNLIEKGFFPAWQHFKEFRGQVLSTNIKGICGECGHLDQCRGGCRAIAFGMRGSLDAEYPMCPKVI